MNSSLFTLNSNHRHTEARALVEHILRPDAGLDFAEVGLVEQHHAEAALADAAADAQGQLAVE